MFLDCGVYCRLPERTGEPAWAVFLDRDGVIVEETNYLHQVEEIAMVGGAAEAIRRLNDARVPVVVVTNQAGVGRGYYEWADFLQVQQEIEARLGDAHLDAVLACPYHVEHPFRKPNPGMLLHAASAMRLDLSRSWLVGDKISDIEAGIRGGLAGAILVRTGYGHKMETDLGAVAAGSTKLFVAADLAEAIGIILSL